MAKLVPAEVEQPQPKGKSAKLIPVGDAKESNPILGDDPLRQVALGSRAVAKGALLPFLWTMDLPMMLRNQVAGTNYPKPSQLFDEALTAAGAPVPQTSAEKVISAVNEGGAGAVSLGLGSVPGKVGVLTKQVPEAMGPTVQAGAIGAGAGEFAKEQGWPLPAQIAASVLTPMGVDALRVGGRAIYQTMASPAIGGASPYTQGGRDLAAANVLARNTSSPGAVVERLGRDQTIVPGVTSRTAEVADDFGLAQVDKLLQNTRPGYRGEVFGMEGANNRILRDRIANAVPEDAAQRASEAASRLTAQRNASLQSADNVTENSANGIVRLLDELADSKLAVSDKNVRPALEEVRKKLYDSKGNLITDPDRLDGVRQFVSKMIAGNFDTPENKFSKANQALHGVLERIKGTIEGGWYPSKGLNAPTDPRVPGYQASLAATAQQMKPVEQRELLNKLLEKSSSKQDILPGGEDNYRLLLSKLNSSLQNERMAAKTERVLTDEQLKTVGDVVRELERGARLTSMQKNRLGSDTFQNLSSAALFGRILGLDLKPEQVAKAPDYVQKVMGWISNMGGKPQERIMTVLEEAMKDPAKARELLKKAPAANLESFGEAASRKGREYAGSGALGARE